MFLEWSVCGGSVTTIGLSARVVVSCDKRYSGDAILPYVGVGSKGNYKQGSSCLKRKAEAGPCDDVRVAVRATLAWASTHPRQWKVENCAWLPVGLISPKYKRSSVSLI